MGRRRGIALRDTAGVHHVASRLSHEGFRAPVTQAAGGGAEILVDLPGGWGYAAVAVRTTECPAGFGVRASETPDDAHGLLVAHVPRAPGGGATSFAVREARPTGVVTWRNAYLFGTATSCVGRFVHRAAPRAGTLSWGREYAESWMRTSGNLPSTHSGE